MRIMVTIIEKSKNKEINIHPSAKFKIKKPHFKTIKNSDKLKKTKES